MPSAWRRTQGCLLSTWPCTCIAPWNVSTQGRSFYVSPQLKKRIQSSKIGGLNRPRHIWGISRWAAGHLPFLLQRPGRFAGSPSLHPQVIPSGIHVPIRKDVIRPNFSFVCRNGKCGLFWVMPSAAAGGQVSGKMCIIDGILCYKLAPHSRFSFLCAHVYPRAGTAYQHASI